MESSVSVSATIIESPVRSHLSALGIFKFRAIRYTMSETYKTMSRMPGGSNRNDNDTSTNTTTFQGSPLCCAGIVDGRQKWRNSDE